MPYTPIVSAAAMRELEAAHFAAGNADPLEWMAIAGRGCAERFAEFFAALPPRAGRKIVVLAGHGNNGGDGIVIAHILAAELLPGVPVEIQFAMPPEKLSPAAAFYLGKLAPQVKTSVPDAPILPPGCVVVDALLGSGIRPPLRAPYDRWISMVNAAHHPVFSVDFPSGIGSRCGIRADVTAAIGLFKEELFTAEGVECAGRLLRVPLPLAALPEIAEHTPHAADAEFYRRTERPVPADAHKYSRGSVLIAGGSAAYPHAPVLSSLAALRTGAGLVTLALPDPAALPAAPLALIARNLPGMHGAFSADSLPELTGLAAKAAAIAAGPGLGRAPQTMDFVRGLLDMPQPLLLDADALFFAAQMPGEIARRQGITVLTPHAGEAVRLAASVHIDVQDRPELAEQLARAFHAVVVLKGPRTVIAAPTLPPVVNTSGTPALATAGSGDVLTGMIAAELAARRPVTLAEAQLAAARAVWLHGAAGELAAAEFGPHGVIADDLPGYGARARRETMK